MFNNYTKNDTGLSIEGYAYYDADLARSNFIDCFDKLDDDFFFFTDFGNINTPEKIRDVAVFDIHTPYNLLQEVLEGSIGSRGELIQELLDLSIEKLSRMLGIGVVRLKKGFSIYTTRGYCQGDIEHVLINEKELMQNRCADWNMRKEHKCIDQYFWDSPITVWLQIEDEEVNYWDYSLDEYEWDKQKFIEAVNKTSKHKGEELVRELNNLLPETLPYN